MIQIQKKHCFIVANEAIRSLTVEKVVLSGQVHVPGCGRKKYCRLAIWGGTF